MLKIWSSFRFCGLWDQTQQTFHFVLRYSSFIFHSLTTAASKSPSSPGRLLTHPLKGPLSLNSKEDDFFCLVCLSKAPLYFILFACTSITILIKRSETAFLHDHRTMLTSDHTVHTKDNRVEVCHKVKPFTIREQKRCVLPLQSQKFNKESTRKKWFSLIVEVQNVFELLEFINRWLCFCKWT